VKISAASRQETGHRRAGFYWTPTQTVREVTEEQLAELKADDQIVLVEWPKAEAVVAQAAERAARK
jgi:hypothetical protein